MYVKTGDSHNWMVYVANTSNVAVTGLVNGDFTKRLFKNGVASGVTVTVTEVSNGWYVVTYTPDSDGNWVCAVSEATNMPLGWVDERVAITGFTLSPTELADIFLKRGISNVEGSMSTHRCLAGSIATAVNKKSLSGVTLSIKKTDDTTDLFTATVTTSPTQSPIVSVDPA